jgi:hypothetical protein
VRDWDNTETIVLLALLVGIAMGTFSGYSLALEPAIFTVDNK